MQALPIELVRDGETAVTADGDQRVNAAVAKPLQEAVGAVHFHFASVRLLDNPMKTIPAVGGAQDGAAQMGDLSNGRAVQFHETAVREAFGLHHSVVTFANADDIPTKSPGCIYLSLIHISEPTR